MKSQESLDGQEKLSPVARVDLSDAGAGSFRTSRSRPLAGAPAASDLYARIAVPTAALSCLGVLGLYLKSELMAPLWILVFRVHGEAGYDSGFLQRLGFYLHDLLINLVFLPAAAALLAWLMSRRLRSLFFPLVTIATALLYFFQLRAHAETGHYASLPMLFEAFAFAVHNPEGAGAYLSAGSLFKLAIFLLVLAFVLAGDSLYGCSRQVCARLAPVHRILTLFLAGGLPALACLFLPFAYANYSNESSLHESAVERVLKALGAAEEQTFLLPESTLAELAEEFRRQTAPGPVPAADLRIGAEKGADLLLFVLETTPAKVLDLVESGPALPGLGRLYPRSFVGQAHFSTYPYTSDALYSLLSGLYPQGRRRLLEQPDIGVLPALMSALAPDYVRYVYAPNLYGAEVDDRMFRAFGAERTYYAVGDPDGEGRRQAAAQAERYLAEWEKDRPLFEPALRRQIAERLTLDLQALARLKTDLVAVKKAGRRFCTLFLPQIAHGPWPDLHGRSEVAARGHDLALLQDEWLGEILDLLAANDWLENTIIVFTADHGIRTRAEDPALPIGKLSAYMLQVPLLIHAPRTLSQPVLLPAPTSHIDIAPTLLALLGQPEATRSMQGLPVWQRSPQDRIFLLAAQYAGAEGFVQNGSYYMHHLLSDAVFASDRPDFSDSDLLPPQDPQGAWVRRSLRQAANAQQAIVRRLLNNEQFAGLPAQPKQN